MSLQVTYPELQPKLIVERVQRALTWEIKLECGHVHTVYSEPAGRTHCETCINDFVARLKRREVVD